MGKLTELAAIIVDRASAETIPPEIDRIVAKRTAREDGSKETDNG